MVDAQLLTLLTLLTALASPASPSYQLDVHPIFQP
jgi:hypothetical protein